MWGRVVEIMLGLWLLLSPFIFEHWQRGETGLWVSDFASGGAIIVFAALSFWQPARFAHVLNLAVAFWLIAWGYFSGGYPSAPGYQNEILVGLVLIFFAIIPTNATQPPKAWRDYYLARAREGIGPKG